jgi:hypothetical protein
MTPTSRHVEMTKTLSLSHLEGTHFLAFSVVVKINFMIDENEGEKSIERKRKNFTKKTVI